MITCTQFHNLAQQHQNRDHGCGFKIDRDRAIAEQLAQRVEPSAHQLVLGETQPEHLAAVDSSASDGQRIGALIVQTIVPNRMPLPVVTFSPEIEMLLNQAVRANPGAEWPFEHGMAMTIVEQIGQAVEPLLLSTRSFALAIRSGVSAVHGLTLVAQVVDNRYVADRIEKMREGGGGQPRIETHRLIGLHRHRERVAAQQVLHLLASRSDDLGRVHAPGIAGDGAGIDTGKVDEVLEQAGQALDLPGQVRKREDLRCQAGSGDEAGHAPHH